MYKVNIHPSFCIDGKGFSVIDLIELGYSYIKEGAEFEKDIGQFVLDWIDSCPTLNVRTSGSTGVPKSIVLKKEYMVNSALATGSYFALSPRDSALLCLPATYIAGKMMLVRAMVLGLDLHIGPPTSNPLKTITKSFDFGAMVPLQVLNSIPYLTQIRTLLVGGAPISTDLRVKIKMLDNKCYETYGMTETITHIAVRPLNHINGLDKELSFKTLPAVYVSKDERDCLVIQAPKVSNEKVVTNDVVELLSSSEFKWLGRLDNVINSGGIKLNPEQIESKLSSIVDQSFFISSVPDPKLGERLVLVLEGAVEEEDLSHRITSSDILTKYEIPRLIKTIPEFIRTDSGKIKRKETMSLLNSSLP
ncbi:AMP-binding protein [Maribacter sp. ACAM166]|uniref:AMP-binding protein n=1 Tax=Maribacter sp. ACAM166 TaxID=2508996 RepID=UPI0010FE978A|nr:AMP-binding protein [Maribacter sp. ACAM166]TLP77599.1 O-succinylbenzoic acid--CoA ligase [Maribacter sp. ACAM166]